MKMARTKRRNRALGLFLLHAILFSLFTQPSQAAELPLPPQNFTISGDTASWSPPANERTVPVLNYVLQYSYDGIQWDNYTFPFNNETRKSIVKVLFSRTIYGYRIAAETSGGRGDFSPVVILAPQGTPATPGVVKISTSGLSSKYGPKEKVSYRIIGTPGDTCQISYQNQAAKNFTIDSVGFVTASFTTGEVASQIVIRIDCTKSGSIIANTELVIPTTPLPTTTAVPTVLPGVDASVNSALTSIIEPRANTCEDGELSVVRGDGAGFALGDSVKAVIFNDQGVELSLSNATKSAQAGDKDITLKVRICQSDRAYVGVDKDYRLLMTYSDSPGYFVQTQEFIFKLISRIEVANFYKFAVDGARRNCAFDQRSIQNSFIQSGTTRKVGEKMTIKGTLYRSGFASPGDVIRLIKVVNSSSSKVLSSTKTDREGNYSFTFPVESFPKALFYRISAPERTTDLGPVPGPFPAKEWDVFIDCKKGCKIRELGTSPPEPVLEFAETCLNNLSFYNQVLSQNDDENSRLLRKVIIYPLIFKILKSRSETNAIAAQKAAESNAAAAAAAAAAASNASNRSGTSSSSSAPKVGSSGSSSASSGSSGGRCYVRGYTTKKGKRVSGYYRSC
jgi:hypothetical protein